MQKTYKLLTFLLALIVLLSCKPWPVTPIPPPTSIPIESPSNPTSTPAELILGEVHIEHFNDQYLNYQVVAEIMNEGTGTDDSFNAFCTYQCPAGDLTTSAGFDIVQKGYLEGASRFTYKMPFHYMCTASPPTINLTCTIEPSTGNVTSVSRNVSLP